MEENNKTEQKEEAEQGEREVEDTQEKKGNEWKIRRKWT